jgi:hypothetical protein
VTIGDAKLVQDGSAIALPPHLRRIERNMRDYTFAPYTISVAEQDIAKFATAIGTEDPIYFDAEVAKAKLPGARGVLAPRAFHISLGTARGRIVPRNQYGGDGLPAVEQLADARLVVGGSTTEYFDEIYAGDEITVEQEIVSITPRSGRSGPMLFIELARRYRRGDALVVLDRITQIFR